MLRTSVLALVSIIVLAACGDNTTTKTEPTSPIAEATPPAPPPPAPTRDEAIAAMAAEKTFQVIFDTCPVSDEGWEGDADPYGTIKCGATYSVTFSAATGQYTATGLNEGSGAELTSAAAGATPAEGGISIWGATFVVGDNGVVSTSDGVKVGHFKLN